MTEEQKKDHPKKKQLIVYLDENVHRALKMKSVMDSTSMNALVTDALRSKYDLGITQNESVGVVGKTE